MRISRFPERFTTYILSRWVRIRWVRTFSGTLHAHSTRDCCIFLPVACLLLSIFNLRYRIFLNYEIITNIKSYHLVLCIIYEKWIWYKFDRIIFSLNFNFYSFFLLFMRRKHNEQQLTVAWMLCGAFIEHSEKIFIVFVLFFKSTFLSFFFFFLLLAKLFNPNSIF